MKNSTSCAKLVELLLYKHFRGNAATRWGHDHEHEAFSNFYQITNLQVTPSGFVIYKNMPFLGASPDGFENSKNALVEIKCPFMVRNLSPQQAIIEKKIKY